MTLLPQVRRYTKVKMTFHNINGQNPITVGKNMRKGTFTKYDNNKNYDAILVLTTVIFFIWITSVASNAVTDGFMVAVNTGSILGTWIRVTRRNTSAYVSVTHFVLRTLGIA